jgi:phage shock protein E
MSEPTQRERLLALFHQTENAIDDFVSSRTLDELQEHGQVDQWSAGDLLTAIAFWMDYTVERMGYFQRGEEPPREVDFGAVEAQAVRSAAGRPWRDAVAGVHRAMTSLMAMVDHSSDALLTSENYYGEGPGGPFCGEIQANGFIWPLQELEKYLQRVGEPERAEQVRALLAPVVGEPEVIVCELVSPEQVRAWQLDPAQAPMIIDVRGAADFARGHLPGARRIPLSRLEAEVQRLPRDRRILTYCNMYHPGQSRGEHAARLLSAAGLQAMALSGGYPAWEAAGMPAEATTQPQP